MGQLAEERQKYALIAHVAKKVGGTGRLGKKALQKLVFLMQEIAKIPAGYRYSFYTYGPYSADLAGDLDIVHSMRGIIVRYDSSSNSYDIAEAEENDQIVGRGQDFLNRYAETIEKVISKYGSRTAKDLELVSTIVFLVNRDQSLHDEDSLAKKVLELKPKYTREQISQAVAELRDDDILPMRGHA